MISFNDVIFVLSIAFIVVGVVCLMLHLGTAYSVGNKYRVDENSGHKNNFFERLHDGLETLKKM